MLKTLRYTSCLLWLFCTCLIQAQELPRVAKPYIAHYTKADYLAENQNWGLSVDVDGVIYSANSAGLLRFDGQEWRLHRPAKGLPLRSVQVAPEQGRIYTGGKGEFGFWTNKGFGRLAYTSLSSLADEASGLKTDDIWRIIIQDNRVIFQAFSKAYVYEDGKIKTISAAGEPFLFGFQVGNSLYFEQLPSGLHEYKNGKLLPLADQAVLRDKHVLAMLPFANGQILIATERHGLFLLDQQGRIRPWITRAQSLFEQHQINAGLQVGTGLYAFGTIKNGLVIINDRGEIVQQINKNSGLQNNTILSMTMDRQANLWIGLDNGIDRIDLHRPLYYYNDLTGMLGTVYASAIFQNQLFLGTNQGLFKSAWRGPFSETPLQFEFVQNSNGQVWNLQVMDDVLYCGHNNGLFAVEGNQLKRLSNYTGSLVLYPLPDGQKVLQGNYTGLSLFDRQAGGLSHVRQYPDIKQPVKYIAPESVSTFWIGNENDLQLLEITPDLQNAKVSRRRFKGIPEDIQIHGIYELAGQNVFATDTGIFRFDQVLQEFIPYEELNSRLGTLANTNRIQQDQPQSYWFFNQARLSKLHFGNDGQLDIDSLTWGSLSGRMMSGYENLLPINSQVDLIGLNEGFALYTRRSTANADSVKSGSPVFSGFWNTTGELTPLDTQKSIPFGQNNIRIAYSIPWFDASPSRYQVRLLGFMDTFSEWGTDAYKDFTNLPFGTYTFEVRAMDASGQVSAISAFSFTIARPWYWSWLAIFCYAVVAIALIVAGRKWYKMRMEKTKSALRNKLQAEKDRALERENEQNQHRMMLLKTQQLEQELTNKKRELANMATNVVYKNELLTTLHGEISNIKDATGKSLTNEQLKKVNKLIDEAKNDEREWELFESSFNESHDDFFRKLKANYPELVPNDLKLCAYLRLNMSSKEIASLLNISLRGVEIRRYRLRKKLHLETNKNLTEFLLEI